MYFARIHDRCKRFYYWKIKELVERHDETRFRLRQQFEMALLVVNMARTAVHIYSLRNLGRNCDWWQYDYFAHFIHHNRRLYDGFIGYIVLALLLFALVGMRNLYFRRVDCVTWQMFYDLVVRSTESYALSLKSNESMSRKRNLPLAIGNKQYTSECIAHFYWQIRANRESILGMENLHKFMFARRRPLVYANLSLHTRIRLIVLVRLIYSATYLSNMGISK